MWWRLLQQLNQPCFDLLKVFSTLRSLSHPFLSLWVGLLWCDPFEFTLLWTEYSYFNRLWYSLSRNETRFPVSTSQNAASNAWRSLRWTKRRRWNTAKQNAGLPRVSGLKFNVKWPCCLQLSSNYCGINVVKWVLHSCIVHTLCTLKYTYVLHTTKYLKIPYLTRHCSSHLFEI
jgi:hypothetical protein